jgi:hypothetical protein
MAPRDLMHRLQRLASSLGFNFHGVIVANAPGINPAQERDWAVIQGSNATHDFSAYAEGLAHLTRSGPEMPDAILFLNDSLFASHSPRANIRATLHQLSLVRQIKVPTMGGKVDRYALLCHGNPWSGLPVYVSTYCFLLNQAAYSILESLQDMADADSVTPDRAINSPEWGVGVAPNFREFIRAYVSYRHESFSWPGLNQYAIGDRLISIKARCIYLEHRLTGEIGKVGCIVPVNARTLDRVRLNLAERFARIRRAIGIE